MDSKIYGFLRRGELGEFIYCCTDCTEIYNNGTELEQHILLTHDPEDSSADIHFVDTEAFSQSMTVEEAHKYNVNDNETNHSNAHAPIVDISDDENETKTNGDIESDQSDAIMCDQCGVTYKTKKQMARHMELKHHPDRHVHFGAKKRACTICGGKFVDLRVHMRTHTKVKPYTCTVCNSSYSHSSYLNIHMRSHTGETPYICDICGRSFRSQGKLTHHSKRHSNVKQHPCDQCDRAYHERFELQKHIDIVHKGIRLFTCDVCDTDYKFTTRKSLKQHKLLHGEKRFSCKFCDQKFAQSSGRRGHEKRVHGAV